MPQTPRSAAPACAPRTEALDELISKSLELCDNAERKLETVAGSLETLDGPPRRHPSAASGRSADRLPRQGTHGPWRAGQNYLEDVKILRFDPIEDGYLEFDGKRTHARAPASGGILRPLRSALFGS